MNSPGQGTPQVKRERRTQNVVPVTIKMINDIQGENLVIGETEVSMVVIVGLIRSVDVSSTKTTYVLEDSTGEIEGVQWETSDSEFDQDRNSSLMEMTYCKVIGSLRTQREKKHIMIFNIVPVIDLNRITTHLLEVLHTSAKIQEIQKKKMNGAGPANPNFNNSFSQQVTQPFQGNVGNMSTDNSHGLSGNQKLIYQIIKLNTDESGIHKQAIYDSTSAKVNRQTVDKVLDDLTSEGLIFTSIDDFHFKTADTF
ncbi:Replication protein A subunit [Armadillidium nasatum]|uniref:Replication protein A subunit n=1 Tax=Armadillidium nasatum TaxID=96803 RepID=A0A5N5TJB7_9CRUS|nr:Replication protein A subunit [Armadillidium nasatum]